MWRGLHSYLCGIWVGVLLLHSLWGWLVAEGDWSGMTDRLILEIPEELNKAPFPVQGTAFGIGVVCLFNQLPTKADGWELFQYRECSWLHFLHHSLKCLNVSSTYSTHCLTAVCIKQFKWGEKSQKVTHFKPTGNEVYFLLLNISLLKCHVTTKD